MVIPLGKGKYTFGDLAGSGLKLPNPWEPRMPLFYASQNGAFADQVTERVLAQTALILGNTYFPNV